MALQACWPDGQGQVEDGIQQIHQGLATLGAAGEGGIPAAFSRPAG